MRGHIRTHIGLLTLLSFFCTSVLFFFFLREPIGSDDCSYFVYALGDADIFYANGHRRGLILLIQLASFFFGKTILTYYAVPFVATFATLLALSLLALRFSTLTAALMVPLLYCADPIVLMNQTLLLPETVAMPFFLFGILFLFQSIEQDTNKTWWVSSILAAFSFFCAYTVKETFLLCCVGFVFAPFFYKRFISSLVLVVVAGLIFVGIEFSLFAIFDGDFFYRINVISGGHIDGAKEQWILRGLIPENLQFFDLTFRFPRLFLENALFSSSRYLWLSYYEWTYLLLALALVFIFLKKQKSLQLLFIVALSSYLIITFAVASFDPVIPLLRTKGRYFIPVASLMSLLISAALFSKLVWSEKSSETSRFVNGVTVGSFSVLCLGFISFWSGAFEFTSRNGMSLFSDAAQTTHQLKTANLDVSHIVANYRITRPLQMYLPSVKMASEAPDKNDLYIQSVNYLAPPSEEAFWKVIGAGKNKRHQYGFLYGFTVDQLPVKKFPLRTPLQKALIGKKRVSNSKLTAFKVHTREISETSKNNLFLFYLKVRVPESKLRGFRLVFHNVDGTEKTLKPLPYINGDVYSYRFLSDVIDLQSVKSISAIIDVFKQSEIYVLRRKFWIGEVSEKLTPLLQSEEVLSSIGE